MIPAPVIRDEKDNMFTQLLTGEMRANLYDLLFTNQPIF